jgi:tetratricopeptide (TPR) repeat protein
MGKEVDALELLVRARSLTPNDTNVVFLMAQLSMKQSFFEDAIELLNEGLKIDPRRADFHAALGESYFTVGKTDKALEEFKTLVSMDSSPRSYVFMGLCYRHLGKFDEAKDYLKKSLGADPNNVPALFNLGFIARKERDYLAAEKYLRRAVQLDGNYPEALFELGGLRMDEKKFQEALPLFRHFVEVAANPTQGYYKLAICERNLHQQETSERDMNVFKTLSKNPQTAPYPLQHFFDYLQRRSTLSEEQQNETDLRDLELEVRQHPDPPRSLYLLAETLLKLGRTKDALQTLQRLDVISAADFRTELSTGVLLGRFHLYADAVQYFQTALNINPASDDAKYNLAEAEFQSGNYETALKSLLQVSEDGRKESSFLGTLGDVYSRLGHYEDAVNCLRQAIAATPDTDQYYVSLTLIQLRAGDLDNADRAAKAGLALIPDSGVLFWAAGVVAVARGQVRGGERLLSKASELSPSGEAIAATLGMFYYEEGRFSEAREVLRKCKEMFPQGTLDFDKIDAVLDAASNSGLREQIDSIPPEGRKQFYELALSMRDQER